MHKISILVVSCLFICLVPKFTNGVKMPYISNEEFDTFRLFLKREIVKAFPSDGDDPADVVIQEPDGKRNVVFYKFGETNKPVFLSTGLKYIGHNVIVLLRGDDYIDKMNKKKFVVLRKRGSGNEYNVHLAQIWLDYNNVPNVVFENVEISILPSVSKLIAYLHEAFGSYKIRGQNKKMSLRPKCGWFGFNLLCDNGEKLKLGDLGSLFPGTSSFGWYGEKESGENGDGDNGGGSIGSVGGSGNGGSGATSGNEDSGLGEGNGGSGAGGGNGTNGAGGGKGTSEAGGGHGSSGAAGGHKDSGASGANGGSGKGSSGAASGHKDSGAGTSGSGGGNGGGSGNEISFDDLGNEGNDEAEYFVKLKGEGAPGAIHQKKPV